jgi:very-short-patch-repair endonuclease
MKEEYLRAAGWRILRIRNEHISQSFGEVQAQIIAAIGD